MQVASLPRQRRTRPIVLSGALGVAAVLTGCGDDEGATSPESAGHGPQWRLSHRQWWQFRFVGEHGLEYDPSGWRRRFQRQRA